VFAVVKSGGKQYRVSEGQELVVDRLVGEVGDSVELPVGFVADEASVDLGERTAKVEILEHLRGDKIHVYKYKPKKDYRKKTGHRQALTRVRVLEVSNGSYEGRRLVAKRPRFRGEAAGGEDLRPERRQGLRRHPLRQGGRPGELRPQPRPEGGQRAGGVFARGGHGLRTRHFRGL
jgi:large subunit ribosomal protein L21